MTSARDSPPPPAYYDASKDPQVDDLTEQIKLTLKFDPDKEIPTEDETLAHLKLLHVFSKLRTSISQQNGLFGLYDEDVTNVDGIRTQESKCKSLLTTLQEKRWAVFVTRAVDRFEAWWSKVLATYKPTPLTWTNMEYTPAQVLVPRPRTGSNLKRNELPPLDVLMVWHAYMLNPRCYLEDCLLAGAFQAWSTGMPWEVVNEAITSENEEYDPGQDTKQTFETMTGRKWNNLNDPDNTLKPCPGYPCSKTSKKISLPYTAIDRSQIVDWAKKCGAGAMTEMPAGNGFADSSLKRACVSCAEIITHEFLRAGKFNRDFNQAERPFTTQRPMRGTILDSRGQPSKIIGLDARTFPNKLLKAMDEGSHYFSGAKNMEDIRKPIERAVKNRKLVYSASTSKFARPPEAERITIRRMMSRYWNNSSPFALDLVGAVLRQGSFIEKMENIDWLHSPAARSTMSRLITKYERFFSIMSTNINQKKLTVPTLDVDLAWHTHQLTPAKYYAYSVKKTGSTFVDHDDKISETKLSEAFAETSKTYQKLYKEPYSECTCWYCEAIRATHNSGASRLLRRSSITSAESELYESPKTATSDPEKGPHLSAHNAIRPQLRRPRASAKDEYAKQLEETEKQLILAYEKACKRAKKAGRPPPPPPPFLERRRNAEDASLYYWLPFGFYPIGVPYYGYACDPSVTAANPSCADMTTGGQGNCAAGTCGGGVAAGVCGTGAACGWGADSGACGSGGIGGCGSGGGGCGGGGGGGGGGGCGGGCGGCGGCGGG